MRARPSSTDSAPTHSRPATIHQSSHDDGCAQRSATAATSALMAGPSTPMYAVVASTVLWAVAEQWSADAVIVADTTYRKELGEPLVYRYVSSTRSFETLTAMKTVRRRSLAKVPDHEILEHNRILSTSLPGRLRECRLRSLARHLLVVDPPNPRERALEPHRPLRLHFVKARLHPRKVRRQRLDLPNGHAI